MKTKICTSIEQSRELIKLGLDPKTADMFWRDWRRETELITIPCVGCGNEKEDLPAWSLSALLELIPHENLWGVELSNYGNEVVWTSVFQWKKWDEYPIRIANNPLDAIFKLICYLIEQGYIKTEKK